MPVKVVAVRMRGYAQLVFRSSERQRSLSHKANQQVSVAKAYGSGFALRDWLTKKANPIVEFLDLYLQSHAKVENSATNGRWPLHKSLLFIAAASVVLWAVVFVVAWFLFFR